ncbi:MAG: DUF444 family protein [Bradymonadales bacterium]|nr:MAG: DUF444 family protein [Bradymonadales bacterium]
MDQRTWAFTVAILCFALCAGRAEAHWKCADAVGKLTIPKIRVWTSDRDSSLASEYEKAAKLIYQDIALKLGLRIPDMVIQSVNGSDMAALTSSFGQPVVHWIGGRDVESNAARAGGILEFVEKGQDSDVQIVRDTNRFSETLLVYAHVAGHLHFSNSSPYLLSRDGDRIRDSEALSTAVSRAYENYGFEAVSWFYQTLYSLTGLQDYARASFEPPESFKMVERDERPRAKATEGPLGFQEEAPSRPSHRFPRTETKAILQFLAQNLPEETESYRREIIRHFERVHRVGPGIVNTKIMNEGFAVLMQFVVLSHTPYFTDQNIMDFAALNATVTRQDLSNPYWLGLQAWLRVRDRFFEANDLSGLSQIEQDLQFIEWATENIISRFNDYSFVQMALDAAWVEKHNLFLYREAKHGVDPIGYGEKANIAISRDPKRIVRRIAKAVADLDHHFPQVYLKDFKDKKTGLVVLRHEMTQLTPLTLESIVKMAYLLSKEYFGRPVRFEGFGSSMWFGSVDVKNPIKGTRDLFEMAVIVDPTGEVRIETEEEAFRERLEAWGQESLNSYLFDLSIGNSKSENSERFNQLVSQAMELNHPPAVEVFESSRAATTAASSVMRYQDFVRNRSAEIFRLVAEGKWPVKTLAGGKKVRVQVTPELPQFRLDQKIRRFRLQTMKRTPVETMQEGVLPALGRPVEGLVPSDLLDLDLNIGSGHYRPGDLFPIPENEGSGQGSEGEGEGTEQGSEGEEKEGESDSGDPDQTAPGGTASGEGAVDIPIELFGKIIAEGIQLRNLQRKVDGRNPTEVKRRRGRLRQMDGTRKDMETAEALVIRGMMTLQAQGKDHTEKTDDELLEIGMMYAEPEDFVVSNRRMEQKPDFDAVIFYVADTSGSMSAEHRAIERQMVAYVSAVLRTLYPYLEERFYIYDTDAQEVDRKEFFTRSLGGGTSSRAALELVEQSFEKHPRKQWNRFILHFSDGGEGVNPDFLQWISALAERVEHYGYAHIDPQGAGLSGGMTQLSEAFKELSERHSEKIGFVELSQAHESLVHGLRRLYGKEQK